MRHELPSLPGSFPKPEAPIAGPPFGTPFIVVLAILSFTFAVCLARVLLP
ncbi:hypothetical protein [Mesorhizobium sp. WSM3862]|nr:hypothetical protein [Mesorhizobium sp. WSM3862]